MSTAYDDIESRIQRALSTSEAHTKPNYAQLARQFDVPYQRLLARSKGRTTLYSRPSGTLKLNTSQNYVLREYIRYLDSLGVPPHIPHVVHCANTILRADHDGDDNPPTVDNRWARAWLRREPDIYVRRQRHLELNRRLSHDVDTIRTWYEGFHNLVVQYGVDAADIWNFDETGFRIGIGKDQWILTFHPFKRHFLAAPDNRESLTLIEAVSGAGSVIPPFIIISGSQLLERYFVHLPDHYGVAMSETGYNNDKISLEWVKHFERQSRATLKGTYRLLLFDGFDSHLTREFLEVLEDHRIIPYRLPPHSTHLLQPLDVSCFQPYKHWHAEAVDSATRTGCTAFNKVEFLAALKSIRYRTFKKDTIKRGWRETGLIPYRPDVVLRKIRDDDHAFKDLETPSTPPRQRTNLDPNRILSPIKTYQGFTDHLKWLQANERHSLSNNARITLRGARQIALAGEHALIQMKSMTATAQARQERQKRGRRILNSEMGIIRSHQARSMTKKRDQDEFNKGVQRWLKDRSRLHTAHRKAFEPIHKQLRVLWTSMRAAGWFSYEDS
jgi:hypothetical protein